MVGDRDEATAAMLRVMDPDPARAEDKYEELFFRLRRFFRSRHRLKAEELAQETLCRGLSRIRAGAVIYVDPVRYFLKIARNVAIEHWRSAQPEPAILPEDLPDPKTVDLGSVDAGIYLEQCLRSLSDLEREVLLRYQVEDHVELARALGMSHVNLRVIAHRAKKKVTTQMRRIMPAAASETNPRVGPLKE